MFRFTFQTFKHQKFFRFFWKMLRDGGGQKLFSDRIFLNMIKAYDIGSSNNYKDDIKTKNRVIVEKLQKSPKV